MMCLLAPILSFTKIVFPLVRHRDIYMVRRITRGEENYSSLKLGYKEDRLFEIVCEFP